MLWQKATNILLTQNDIATVCQMELIPVHAGHLGLAKESSIKAGVQAFAKLKLLQDKPVAVSRNHYPKLPLTDNALEEFSLQQYISDIQQQICRH